MSYALFTQLMDVLIPRGVSIILKLPDEIICLIFEELHDYHDRLLLSMTCQRLWELGRRPTQKLIMDNSHSWAGDRIICVGDYVDVGDHPKGLLTEAEEEELAMGDIDRISHPGTDDDEDSVECEPLTLYFWGIRFSKPKRHINIEHIPYHSKRMWRLPEEDITLLKHSYDKRISPSIRKPYFVTSLNEYIYAAPSWSNNRAN